jgi:tetratricopeptide (TPR) repeat protein
MRFRFNAALAAAVVALAPAARADSLQLKDGRFVQVSKILEVEGGYKLIYNNGEVFVKKDLVNVAAISDSSGNYVPKTDEEKAKVEKGLVPHEGKWISKADRDKAVQKKVDDAKKLMEETKKHQEWRDRYQEKTPHFHFQYTIPQAKAKEYMEMMEVYFNEFAKKWGIQAPKDFKVPVCFYHDEEYYYQVSGAPYGAIGYFRFVDPIELNFYYDRNDERLTLDVMFHETNHYLTYLINPKFNYPPWINESFAEYYGASQWDPAKKKMSVGHIQEGRLVVLMDAMASDEFQGLEEMMKMDDFAALHYAWGWSFIHYLMESKKYAAGFQKFYLGLAKDKDVARVPFQGDMVQCEPKEVIRVFQKYTGVKDLKALEKEWHDYVKGLKLESHRGYEDAAQWADRWGLHIKAGRYYRTAIEKGTQNPLTFYNYGDWLCHPKEKNYEEAVKMYEKAMELDPFNADFYMRCGHALNDLGNTERAERMKKLACEMDPNNPWLELQAKGVFRGK